ncbi:E3 ubiquitin-protein ligase RMND5A [Plutella xylostella]|uniref:E3 ubiquitin-protein ligase RMND5A n=1 Tax=Plutella xylostella TaxID=51655 RepID=UPI00203226B0|nr:E3 ubiquitin-protein ligase RMND5A [Plutella xylostella]
MDSCLGVEQDLDKAISKLFGLSEHADRILQDAVQQIQDLKNEIANIPPDTPLTDGQAQIVKETTQRIKEALQHLATDHRDLHASVSRVGKSIDRHFIADYASVAPKAESFMSDTNRPIVEQAIAEHLYRQGLEEVADEFVAEAGVTGVERRSAFVSVERIAAALAAGNALPALRWTEKMSHDLRNDDLPFTLHTVHALKLAREEGVVAAIEYARAHFPRHAARHEQQLQRAVCALAWCAKDAPPPPKQYEHLLNAKALGAEAAEMFITVACSLLNLSPCSALGGAVRAGCRVLPALHDMRAKMTQPRVRAAYTTADLPLEVDLGEDGGAHHSVFACPILRQQASEQNPPMRLLCGHVISRDALNKLAQGVKLKCPYCPMEQSPSEARQIYFS